MRKTLTLLAAMAVVVAACDSFGRAVGSHADTVARAAGHELTVDQVAAMVAPHAQVPAQKEVVEALANLWVDYTLLATAAAQDSNLTTIDMDPLLKSDMEQEMVFKLRDKVITVDTTISDEELQKKYNDDQYGLQVRARHILLRLMPDATNEARDSVAKLAEELDQRAKSGEDFALLARAFSEDGSAQQGGDLGFFGRGQMVAPFEDAAFKLGVGEVSDVVVTPFGLHVIKVEDRRQPPFDSIRAEFRDTVLTQRGLDAERDYIEGLTKPLEITVQDGAVENARELAANPSVDLRGRAASRAMVEYKGGDLTAAEFMAVIRTWPATFLNQLIAAQDEQIEQVLEGMTRNEILVAEAKKLGVAPSPEEADSIESMRRYQLRMTAVNAGLTSIQPQDGETMPEAVDRRVTAYLEGILRGEQSAYQIGPVSYSLRKQFKGEIFPRSFDAAVQSIEARRPAGMSGQPVPTPAPGGQPPAPPTAPPDSGSGN